MTLAPDHIAFTHSHEVVDAPLTVSVIPDRKWRHLTLAPLDAPAPTDLPLARDVVLTHLHIGEANDESWEITWAHIVTDLNNPKAIPHEDGRALVADYYHFARLNGSTDWEPQDAEDIHNQIDRHLRAAGYQEGN